MNQDLYDDIKDYTEVKWLKHLASYSKLSFDNDTLKIYYDGKEVEGIEIPVYSAEIIDMYGCQPSMILDAELRGDLSNQLAEVLGLTDLERKQARAKMVFEMEIRG